jgi:hypothetical protein
MSKRPSQVEVVTEVGYCPSCGRTRNLRREEHRLGGLMRTIVTCETCHRTLSSSIGPAVMPEPAPAEPEPEPQPEPAQATAPKRTSAQPAPKKPAVKKPAVEKASAKRPAAAKQPAARGGKPTSTATRKATKPSR